MNVFICILRSTIKREKIYKFNIFTSAFCGLFPVFIMIFLWNVIYSSGVQIPNFREDQIITYYFLTYITSYIIGAENIAREISIEIRTGTVNNLILKPGSHLAMAFGKHVGEKVFQICVLAIPAIIFGIVFRDWLYIMVYRLPFFLIALIIAFLLNYLVFYLIGISSFWFIENGGLIQLWVNILSIISGERFPLSVLPGFFRVILMNFPFKFLIYYPISILIDENPNYDSLIVGVIWVLIIWIIVKIMWRKGVDLNEGVGI